MIINQLPSARYSCVLDSARKRGHFQTHKMRHWGETCVLTCGLERSSDGASQYGHDHHRHRDLHCYEYQNCVQVVSSDHTRGEDMN